MNPMPDLLNEVMTNITSIRPAVCYNANQYYDNKHK